MYNIPFVWVIVKHWNADNISKKFLYIRIIGSISWVIYAILSLNIYIGVSYTVTLISSLIITFVKHTQNFVTLNSTPEPVKINKATLL
jgi:uncharacterized protein with PQ loop repeat